MVDENNSKETFTEKFLSYVFVIILFIVGYGGYQYYQLRGGVQDTTLSILNDNEYNNIKTDGISLPVSIVFASKVNADVFLLVDEEMEIIEVEVIPKNAIPILSIFTGLNYAVSIPGRELLKLRN